MEDFKQIKWFWHTNVPVPNEDPFDQTFSDDESDIFYCHINEIDPVLLQNKKGPEELDAVFNHRPVDPRTGKEKLHLFYNYSKESEVGLFKKFPVKSTVPGKKHPACLRALEKLANPNERFNAKLVEDMQIYTSIHKDLQAERKDFLNFVRNHFYVNAARCGHLIDPSLNEFVLQKWKNKLNDIKQTGGRYRLQTALPLQENSSSKIQLIGGNLVAECGQIYKYSSDILKPRLRNSFDSLKTSSESIERSLFNETSLAMQENVEFFMPFSTVFHLLDTTVNPNQTISINFEIRDVGHSKLIYFDKPLPMESLNVRQRAFKAFKYSLKCALMEKSTNSYNFQSKSECNLIKEKIKYDEKHKLPNQENKAYKLHRFENYLKTVLPKITKKSMEKHGNCMYRKWELKSDSENQNSLSILVRNKIDCYETGSGMDREKQFLYFSPKVEYQIEFGAEQMTQSELIREWLKLILAPDSMIERIRIFVENGKVISTRRVSIQQIENDLYRLYKLQPSSLLQNLYTILMLMKNFPVSSYMLRHTKDHNDKIMIYSKCDSSITHTMDLQKMYLDIETDKSTLDINEWIPIDDMEVTAIHRKHGIIPCTFPYWSKKGKPTSMVNDRVHILKHSERQKKEKLEKLEEFNKLRKRHHGRSKMKKRLRRKERNTQFKFDKFREIIKSVSDGISLDPNEMFDDKGNILEIGMKDYGKNPADEDTKLNCLNFNSDNNIKMETNKRRSLRSNSQPMQWSDVHKI